MLKPLTVLITTNWKILKEMATPNHLTFLLRNLYAGQEATVRTGHGTTDWFQIGKGVCQGCILSLCLFNLYAEYIMQNAGLDEAQAGINCGQKYQSPQICRRHHPYGRKQRIPEKHPPLLHWLHLNLQLYESQQIVENSSRDGNTRPPDLPPEKSVCRSRSNS